VKRRVVWGGYALPSLVVWGYAPGKLLKFYMQICTFCAFWASLTANSVRLKFWSGEKDTPA